MLKRIGYSKEIFATCCACILAGPLLSATSDIDAALLDDRSPNVQRQEAQAPFIWTEEDGATDLGPLPSDFREGRVYSIVNGNSVSGVLTQGARASGFLWDSENGFSILGNFSRSGFTAVAVDESGQTYAGWYEQDGQRKAAIWGADGLVDLNELAQPLANLVLTEARVISMSGAIAGAALQDAGGLLTEVAFLWLPGEQPKIVPMSDGFEARTVDYLVGGDLVVGTHIVDDRFFGYAWRDGEIPTKLETPEGSSSLISDANANAGFVGSIMRDGENPTASLWLPGQGSFIDLNSRLVEPLPEDIELVRASAVNDRGQVGAYGVSNAGSVFLIVLTPTPQEGEIIFSARNLGEVFVNYDPERLPPMSIDNSGTIVGSCSPLAGFCPAPAIPSQEAFDIFEGVTNLFPLPGAGGVFDLSLPDPIAQTDTPFTFGQVLPEPISAVSPGGVASVDPFEGLPSIPSVTSTSTVANAPTIPAVPVPAAIWAMLQACALLFSIAGLKKLRGRMHFRQAY